MRIEPQPDTTRKQAALIDEFIVNHAEQIPGPFAPAAAMLYLIAATQDQLGNRSLSVKAPGGLWYNFHVSMTPYDPAAPAPAPAARRGPIAWLRKLFEREPIHTVRDQLRAMIERDTKTPPPE